MKSIKSGLMAAIIATVFSSSVFAAPAADVSKSDQMKQFGQNQLQAKDKPKIHIRW